MATKICNKCNKEKDESEFHWKYKSKGIRQYHCKECHLSFVKNHYYENKRQYINRSAKRRKEVQEWYTKYKDNLCCEICGENERVCLDFHHKDPTEKEFEIGCYQYYGREKLLEELKKCICVCANCHRKIHRYGLEKVIATRSLTG